VSEPKTSSRERASFLDAPLDLLTLEQTLDVARAAMSERRPTLQVSLNVAKLVRMRRDAELRADVVDADVVSADGMGVVWGARLCGIDVPERVTGVDLMEALLGLCNREGFSPFLLGARQPILEAAVASIRHRFPDLEIAGWHHGYFTALEEDVVADAIRASNADCLIIGISSPKKEEFSRRHGRDVGVGFVMGVGGSLDVWAGLTARAPIWVGRIGLEWAYRLAQEPGRLWKRYLVTNAMFAWLMLVELVRRARRRPALDK
jgi:N-acetylglucosaminyldiphosphoundecaprenol N-acetyl-beta-D-mannosaminyltransferase